MLQIKKWGLYILTAMCFIAIMVCVICDYAMTKKLDVVFDCCAFFACRVACICTFFQRRKQRDKTIIDRYQYHHASFFSGTQRCFEIAPYLINGKQYCRFVDCGSMGNIRGFCKMSKADIFGPCPFAADCDPFGVRDHTYCGPFC